MLRRIFQCLERPDTTGLSSQDEWWSPPGHSTQFRYLMFGGHWGTWHHIYTSDKGPKEWVFQPFVDEQTMIGGKGRMVYKQHHMPVGAVVTGSVWLCPHGSFKRVLSRGGAWENVNPGSKHPDEKDHDDEQSAQPQAEQRDESPEVPVGTDPAPQGDGDDGQVPSVSAEQEDPSVDLPEAVINPDALEEIEIDIEGEGVDGNGSPVV